MLYNTGKFLTFVLLKTFCSLRVYGSDLVPRGPGMGFILAANHTSNIDPFVMGVACPKPLHFMAKAELFNNPFAGALLSACMPFP